MKSFKALIFSIFLTAFTVTGFAQAKTETLKVSGNCGMCKNKIETAAKKAGATQAVWNEDTKELSLTYNTTASNTAKIEKAIAEAGYDTPNAKATDAAYDKLHSCCKYERTVASADSKTVCCDGGSCTAAEGKSCCADGKCVKGGDCCKGGTCTHKGEAHGTNSKAAACCKKA